MLDETREDDLLEEIDALRYELEEANNNAQDVRLRDEEWQEALEDALSILDEEDAYRVRGCFDHLIEDGYDDH